MEVPRIKNIVVLQQDVETKKWWYRQRAMA
jgi:hypothetical protein